MLMEIIDVMVNSLIGSERFERNSSPHKKHGSTFGTWISVARVPGIALRIFIARAMIGDLSILPRFTSHVGVKKLEQKIPGLFYSA